MTTRTQALTTCLFGTRDILGIDGNHLVCPMQCRVIAVVVADTLCFFGVNPTDQSHAIVVKDLMDPRNARIIRLDLSGVILPADSW